jgi:hypothetical protein
MNHLLDVTGADIALLSDADLRVLTGKLCEADYLQAGLPTRGITWGGHQDATDGGVDVRVRRLTELDASSVSPPPDSHVPRAETVFQCKQTKMPPSSILVEMSKPGVARLLGELTAAGGAYVIVSGTSVTDSRYQERMQSMRGAVSTINGSQHLALDFYDQSRIVSWVRRHPALALWVLERVGRPFSGWRSYGYWASGKGTVEDCYLLDPRAKLIPPGSTGEPVPIVEGIQQLRSHLSNSQRAVRLVGLSGVGKTRLAQALFDPRIGSEALNKHQVYYADGVATEPNPIQLADQLIAGRYSAFLVIDNCSEELHRAINQRCCQENSNIRLLTVEYDIKEDAPTETDVYRLQPSDDQLIKELISQRYPGVSQIDRSTIARFSEGNTRVALALADSVMHDGSLAGLGDNALFNRLFYQRNGEDRGLLEAAKAASLVYSFSIDESSAAGSEHSVLASLYGQTPQTMFRMLSELKRRELLQARGPWRAVLPQAISNRLANEALQELPVQQILQAFDPAINQRLLKSFCHRVGFLHDEPIAVQCASDLLSPVGPIGSRLLRSETWHKEAFYREHWDIDCLAYLAPADPNAALRLIETLSRGTEGEHFTSRDNPHFSRVAGLLRKLAYSAELFPRAMAILVRFALSEQPGENNNSIHYQIKPLFLLHLSGTTTPQAIRLEVVESLLNVQDARRNGLGFYLLEAMLQSSGFMSDNTFDFGSRSRGFGYIPPTAEDVQNWYETALSYCVNLAVFDDPRSIEARALLARQWRSLWLNVKLYDFVEKITRDLHAHQPWIGGWLAIKQTIKLHGNDVAAEIKARLEKLAIDIAPTGLAENVRLYLCGDTYDLYDLLEPTADAEFTQASFTQADLLLQEKVFNLGVEVGKVADQIKQLLPELVSSGSSLIKPFCEGLVTSHADITWLVESCCSAWREADQSSRNVGMLIAILEQYAILDRTSYEDLLDQLMVDPEIKTTFPCIQLRLNADTKAIERLIACIQSGSAPLNNYRNLGHVFVASRINSDRLLRLLSALKVVEHSDVIIVESLSALIHGSDSAQLPTIFMNLAREILARQDFSRSKSMHPGWDYELARIAQTSLPGEEGAEAARTVSTNLLERILDYPVSGYHDYPRLMNALATCQPAIFLDVFIGSLSHGQGKISRVFDAASLHDELDKRHNWLGSINAEFLLDWCEHDSDHRFSALAEAVQLCAPTPDQNGRPELAWSPIALELLSRAPRIDDVLISFDSVFFPRSWTGSRADLIANRLPLLDTLEQHLNPAVATWASEKRAELKDYLAYLRTEEKQAQDAMFQEFE